MKTRLLMVLAAAALTAAACGGTANDVAAQPDVDDPGIVTPADPATGAPPAMGACLEGAEDCQDMGPGVVTGDEMPPPNIVEPRPGMDDVAPVDWDEASVEGDRIVTVAWWSGVEPCHVLDHVEVEYTEDAVTITVFQGSEPSDEQQACIEIAERRGTVVELDEPLGPRSLLDGAEA